ncbi:hypothetical protein AVEN_102984-1 [Araneus ventricosus]|uniref:Uncharacterized protein n=1 Tax=Araneus ventricosus TaxID=182803 RepID=A0A4Y2BAK6_ARAVE|nr:hypothetical protein AVEN_102984-1 [Araneus ventricosus]
MATLDLISDFWGVLLGNNLRILWDEIAKNCKETVFMGETVRLMTKAKKWRPATILKISQIMFRIGLYSCYLVCVSSFVMSLCDAQFDYVSSCEKINSFKRHTEVLLLATRSRYNIT